MLAGGARYTRYGEASAFVGFGCYQPASICYAGDNAAVLPAGALVFRTGGYDGQFYYYLAAELGQPGYRARLDADAFRRARIGYPLLVFPAAFAGEAALVLAMIVLPAAAHIAVLLLLLVRLRFLPGESGDEYSDDLRAGIQSRSTPAEHSTFERLALLAFALNPVSLFCFLYALADGLALDLMVLALLLLGPVRANFAGRQMGSWLSLLIGAGFLSLALLTKEHALAGALAVLFATAVVSLFRFALRDRDRPVNADRFESGGLVRSGAVRALVAVVAILVLIAWWRWVGFHPQQAADRGGVPLGGLFAYITGDPDAFFSGRSYLILLFAAYMGIFAALAYAIVRNLHSAWRGLRDDPSMLTGGHAGGPALYWTACAAGVLAANLVLLSFATADEYWGNFANILRLFSPGYGALCCLALAGDGVGNTGARIASARLLRWGLWLALAASLASVFAILENEIAGTLLPVFEFGVGDRPGL